MATQQTAQHTPGPRTLQHRGDLGEYHSLAEGGRTIGRFCGDSRGRADAELDALVGNNHDPSLRDFAAKCYDAGKDRSGWEASTARDALLIMVQAWESLDVPGLGHPDTPATRADDMAREVLAALGQDPSQVVPSVRSRKYGPELLHALKQVVGALECGPAYQGNTLSVLFDAHRVINAIEEA